MKIPRLHLLLLQLLPIFLATGYPLAAQTTKPASVRSAAWTGVVTYTRTHTQTDSKTIERVSGRGKDTRNWEMKYDYKATVGITDPNNDGSSVVKASITHSFTSKETNVAVEKNSCDRGKTWQDMTGTFVSQTAVSGEGKEDANVNIGINSDGTYAISVGVPQIKGTMTGLESSTFSGQCKPKEGKTRNMGPLPTTIDGHSLTSDGSHRFDPANPNRLSGSYSLPLPGGVVESITWNLQKDAVPLRIIDLKFEDMKFPNWDDWREISDQVGTVDGNWVRIKATVFNGSGETKTAEVYLKETYKGDKWDGARPDVPLKDQTFTVRLDPGESREVEMLWDSSGYAWFDDGRPRYLQRIKAEVWENFKKADEMTKNLKMSPRPIVFVPGVWTDPNRLEIYQNILTTAHSYGWKACAVVDTSKSGTIGGEGTVVQTSSKTTVYAAADNLTTYTNSIRGTLNAWHVDMLGHGTGGLIARLYVHKQMDVLPDGYPVVKHLMLVGTPNKGLPCADSAIYRAVFDVNPQTAKELSTAEIGLFNQYVTQRKNTRFSALAGQSIPTVCDGAGWGDGYVPLESAKFGIEDVTLSSATHNDLLGTEAFTNYVKPHIVVGPRGEYPLAAVQK